jgi:hypothetical protein
MWLAGTAAAVSACIVGVVASPVRAQVRFVDVTEQAGLGGVGAVNFSWADYDNDGDPDLLVGCSRLFRNDGPPNHTFTDVTAAAGLSGDHGTWADIDNDGDLDLYCAGQNQNARLWRNNGNGTFSDISDFNSDGVRDMTVNSPSVAGAWADIDLDGFTDMYVGNYERTGNADCDIDTLWRNDGDNTFTNVTTSAGIQAGESAIVNADPGMCARGVTWSDYNNDGYPDVYVSDYRLDQNMLFQNDGDGTFTEVAVARGVDGHRDGSAWGHSLGSEFMDMDNDGDLDLYTSNLAHWWGTAAFGHDISYLWRNNGAGSGFSFTDVRSGSGMHPYTPNPFDDDNDFEEAGPGWADWDNDTIPDLYVPEFYPFGDHWGRLYRGLGGGTFADATDPGNGDCGSGPDPINTTVGPTCLKRWYSWNATWADYDGDGDVDLAVSGNPRFNQCDVVPMPAECGSADPGNRDTWPQPTYLWLFRNEVGSQNHWLHVRLVGQVGNRAAIGARVTAVLGGTSMGREVSGGHGYHAAQHDLPVEFGLGTATQVDSVTIRWPTPGQPMTSQFNLAADQQIVAYETGATVQRGSAKDALAAYQTVQFFPWIDPEAVLEQPGIQYYRVQDAYAEIRVERYPATQSILIRIRN